MNSDPSSSKVLVSRLYICSQTHICSYVLHGYDELSKEANSVDPEQTAPI